MTTTNDNATTACAPPVLTMTAESTAAGQTHSQGSRTRKGAQKGNSNAIEHGLRAAKLPKGCRYIESRMIAFRRAVRDELEQLYGAGRVTVYLEALLQSAIRHETRAALASRWLRMQADLDLAQKTSLLATISQATDARDKCLDRMGLSKVSLPGDADPWQTIDAAPPQAPGDAADERSANADAELSDDETTQPEATGEAT